MKKYPNGKASTHMHNLQPGQTLTVRGPLPGASWKPSTDSNRDVLLVAGGAGITPIYSLTRGILSDPADKTRVQLVWGVNGTRDIVLKDELDSLQKQYPDRLSIVYAVSGPEAKPDAPSLGDEARFRKGYVDKSLLQETISRCQQGNWGDVQGKKGVPLWTAEYGDGGAGLVDGVGGYEERIAPLLMAYCLGQDWAEIWFPFAFKQYRTV